MIVRHKDNCKMAFGRKDSTCPRCQELLNGATPRYGWGARTIISNGKLVTVSGARAKEIEYQQFKKALKEHSCQQSRCGTVCVAFDY